MGKEHRRQEKDVEGPEPGSPEMEHLIRKAEDRGQENAADDADKEEKRQLDEGTENSS